jgi:hypothetical protein
MRLLLIIGGTLALSTALNITMFTPAVSRGGWHPQNEGECESLAHGLRGWAIWCHCYVQCDRKYRYTVTLPCLGHAPPFCERTMVPVETTAACQRTCVKAKGAAPLWPHDYRRANSSD